MFTPQEEYTNHTQEWNKYRKINLHYIHTNLFKQLSIIIKRKCLASLKGRLILILLGTIEQLFLDMPSFILC